LSKEVHLVDHVHSNEGGYRAWDEVLFPVMEEISRLDLVEFGWMKEVEASEVSHKAECYITGKG